ncbi:TetR/AcrR family transcriptional regulator [Actinoplanes teichomyceticus]|uniref:HTH-type transcriptional regulator MT1864/Rv1816-like C-terminal domain-containing protein n=1 Tax=Actinoplanes teichomyceticus TaxID=1867 RepID=A0A561WLQ1_ACTTI|nr:TetR-like C-terminal domain-containing protein [Actinoplanes teichomyceticus]TWG24797.1 hypothetical protein FHX34_1021360 [Actinoplanes teichomyceticus]GIF14541.1 TetR family transcriptional regulator [Actinoplanes teichomyceticus]
MRTSGNDPDPAFRIRWAAYQCLTRHRPGRLDLASVADAAGMPLAELQRHCGSPDALLGELMLDAYASLACAMEQAASTALRQTASPARQWVAVARAVRSWARTHPAEYALLWEPSHPHYRPSPEVIVAGSRTLLVLAGIVLYARTVAPEQPLPASEQLSTAMARNVGSLARGLLVGVPLEVIPPLMLAWSQLLASADVAVQRLVQGLLPEPDAFWDHVAHSAGRQLGLPQ